MSKKRKSCEWSQTWDDDSGCWSTDCGEEYYITEGTPEENNMRFCTFCGCRLKQRITEQEK